MRNCLNGVQSRTGTGSYARVPRAVRFGALAVVAIGAACAIASIWPRVPSGSFDLRCEGWDRTAAAAVVALITERDAMVDRQLGDVVFRLRRARKNCRHNLAALAWFDYQALTDGRFKKLR